MEHVGGDHDATVVAAPLLYHPVGGLILLAGPGLEIADDEEGESESEFLVRTGVAWEFEVGRFSIAPGFYVDFVDGEEIQVYGVSFGMGF